MTGAFAIPTSCALFLERLPIAPESNLANRLLPLLAHNGIRELPDSFDFDGHLVDFDELLQRQKRFLNEEKISLDKFNGKCKCNG